MEKFLSTLFTILIVLFALKWVVKLLLASPWVQKFLIKRLMKMAGFRMPQEKETRQTERGGKSKRTKPTDDYMKPTRREGQTWSDVLGGEYIGYEELP